MDHIYFMEFSSIPDQELHHILIGRFRKENSEKGNQFCSSIRRLSFFHESLDQSGLDLSLLKMLDHMEPLK